MALPSVVTLASFAFVVAAAAGYVAIAPGSTTSAQPRTHHGVQPRTPQTPHTTPSTPATTAQQPNRQQPKPDVVPSDLVVVFNNTGITGLADQKAAILRGAGWNVAATDNWYGNIPEDTVYYPPQLKADAAKLAKVLHITRLHTAVSPMQFDRLTVIIATR